MDPVSELRAGPSSQAESSVESSSQERIVRFDNACTLIPESSTGRRPRVTTKSYSLPLWRRKTQSPARAVASDEETRAMEENFVVLKVPLLSFAVRERSLSHSSPEQPVLPLQPCLVHRSLSTGSYSSTYQRPLVRRTSSPASSRPAILTVPLRACCDNCVYVTEKSLALGEAWTEKWSRGARRLHRKSLSEESVYSADSGNPAPAAVFHPAMAINVDEVDKRRKSFDQPPSPTGIPGASSPSDDGPLPKLSLVCDAPYTASSSQERLDDTRSLSRKRSQATLSSPIVEVENEDELFPLPSPRRTPSASPLPSPTNSLLRVSLVSASKDSLAGGGGSQESSGSRSSGSLPGKGRCKEGLLCPDSPLLQSRLPASVPAQSSSELSPTNSPYLSSSAPTPSAGTSSVETPKKVTTPRPIPIPTSAASNHTPFPDELDSITLTTPDLDRSFPSPSFSSPPSTPSMPLSTASHDPRHSDSSSSAAVAAADAEPASPHKRFHIHMPRMQPTGILRVGAEVLRGVTAMGSLTAGSPPAGAAMSV